jgi:hypothetical protein
MERLQLLVKRLTSSNLELTAGLGDVIRRRWTAIEALEREAKRFPEPAGSLPDV